MRRIVLIIVLVVAVGVAAFFLLRPRRPAGGTGTASTDTSAGRSTRRSSRRARTSGRIQPRSKKELRAERKRRRKEERLRKREARRREREQRQRLREARRRHGSKRRGRKGNLYVVRAIVSLGSESYALVDGRRVGIGDVVMGRRVVEILPDRLEIEAFGRRSSVRVGESLLPTTYTTKRSRRRG